MARLVWIAFCHWINGILIWNCSLYLAYFNILFHSTVVYEIWLRKRIVSVWDLIQGPDKDPRHGISACVALIYWKYCCWILKCNTIFANHIIYCIFVILCFTYIYIQAGIHVFFPTAAAAFIYLCHILYTMQKHPNVQLDLACLLICSATFLAS